MSDTGDRAVSALYITDPQLSRPWSMTLDGLPNQGQLDTSVPSHAVDLDAIQRAGTPRVRDVYARPYPRVVHRRHRRSWRQLAGRVAWWTIERAPAAIVILLACLLTYGLIREMTP